MFFIHLVCVFTLYQVRVMCNVNEEIHTKKGVIYIVGRGFLHSREGFFTQYISQTIDITVLKTTIKVLKN